MAIYNIVEKRREGLPTVRIGFWHQWTSVSTGIGCFSAGTTGYGSIWLHGVKAGITSFGGAVPAEAGGWEQQPTVMHMAHLVTPAQLTTIGLTPEMIQEWVYEDITQTRLAGVLIFGDRINRGTPASPIPKPNVLGGVRFSPAAYANWLKKRPDLGYLMASPVFNNPNHSHSAADYSLVQFWCFFHKSVTPYLYVDEASGFSQPDEPQFTKEKFVEKFMKKFPDLAKDSIPDYTRVTYDA